MLGREGFLSNTRGRGGGLRLARHPSQINLGAVVRATEGRDYPAECFRPDGGSCAIKGVCRLSVALASAITAFYDVLDGYTLEDLVGNRGDVVAILHPLPRAA